MRHRLTAGLTVALAAGILLPSSGCSSPPAPTPPPSMQQSTSVPTPTSSATPGPATSGPAMSGPAAQSGHLVPTGTPATVVENLDSPWSILRLPSGATLISERDSGRVLEFDAGGGTRVAGTVPGVVHNGEGGLLGLAVQPGEDPGQLYAYLTTANDNRVVRMPLGGSPGGYSLGAPQAVITGIPKAVFHDGGRIAFGPDGMLYVPTGDATGGKVAQDKKSLAGKILRLSPTGGIPDDNPFPGSPVYSYGHRNPQGLAWAADGTMWASEFGQDTWDELNVIQPGKNYGWPVVEGTAHRSGYVDPIYQRHTDDASPSGLTMIGDTLFMAGLGGQRLWVIQTRDGKPPVTVKDHYTGKYGRLRDVTPGPNGTLWILTGNTDGRGHPRPGDDRILQVPLSPVD